LRYLVKFGKLNLIKRLQKLKKDPGMNEQFEEALKLLKNAVKYSHLDNQKHLDFSLINADLLDQYKKAMVIVRTAVAEGELTEIELKQKLGLI